VNHFSARNSLIPTITLYIQAGFVCANCLPPQTELYNTAKPLPPHRGKYSFSYSLPFSASTCPCSVDQTQSDVNRLSLCRSVALGLALASTYRWLRRDRRSSSSDLLFVLAWCLGSQWEVSWSSITQSNNGSQVELHDCFLSKWYSATSPYRTHKRKATQMADVHWPVAIPSDDLFTCMRGDILVVVGASPRCSRMKLVMAPLMTIVFVEFEQLR
jgi:hypothetical protein